MWERAWSFLHSAGTVILQNVATGTTVRDYRCDAGLGVASFTGSFTLQIGNALTPAAKSFLICGVTPILVINGAFAHTVTFNTTLTNYNHASRDVLINPGTTLNIGAYVFLFAGTTLTNNGTFNGSTSGGSLYFFGAGTALQQKNNSKNKDNNKNIDISKNVVIPGTERASLFVDEESIPSSVKSAIYDNPKSINSSAQTYTGSGVMTAPTYSLNVDNSLGVNITATNQQVVGRVILFTGNLTGCGKLTLGNGGTTAGTIQIGNTTTPTLAGTFVAPFTFNLGTGGEVISYLRTGSSRTTGGEVSTGRVLTSLTYDDNDITHSLTLAGGNLSVGTLNVTNGLINTNSSNLLTVTGTVSLLVALPSLIATMYFVVSRGVTVGF